MYMSINDLPDCISSSTTRLFADDSVVYREVSSHDDAANLQRDLDTLQACSLSVVDFDVELIHPSMFLVLASAGKFPLTCDVLIFIYNFGETFLQPCKNGT